MSSAADSGLAWRPARVIVTGDRQVTLNDLTILLAHYGIPSGATHAQGDLDGDGDVDLDDLAELLSNFGLPCT